MNYFKFTCEHCGKDLRAQEDKRGKKARCPYCKNTVIIPCQSKATIPTARPAETTSEKISAKTSKKVASKAVAELGGTGVNVSPLRSFIVGLIIAAAFMVVILPFKGTYFHDLFWRRGWVPFVLVLLFGWSVAILVLKWLRHRRHRDVMLFDVLPNIIADTITAHNAEKFISHVRKLPVRASGSFMINRVLRGLEHFTARRNNGEVASLMNSQSDIDANAVESSYTLVRVFTWAIPILGFIGTVIGISAAVGGFSGELDSGADIEDLKAKLGTVTTGLGIAFDTTLVALVMSLIIAIPSHALQKSEDDLLNWVDEYCNENLLKRLDDGGGGASATGQLAPEVYSEIRQVQEKVTELHESQIAQMEHIAQTIHEQAEVVGQEAAANMETISERSKSAHTELSQSLTETTDRIHRCFTGLEEGMASLNRVLEKLGHEHVVVEVRKRGLFNWGALRKKNKGNGPSKA